jgi:soluble lytic murein transglycosylase-like protein
MRARNRFSSPLAAAFCALLLGLAATGAAHAEAQAATQATEPVATLTGRTALLPLIAKHARANAIPEALADAVAHVESSYVTRAVGGVGEIGLMQLRPATAAMLGFAGTEEELFQPDVNIRYGVLYLAQAWRMTDGDLCRTLMKYRAGHGETRMTQRSVDYCVRARAHLASIGSELADAPVPAAVTVGSRSTQGSSRRSNYNFKLWNQHQRQMQAIERRVTRDSLSIMR